MADYMDDSMAEDLGKHVGAEPGRVTWLASAPGTGKSRVLAAFVRQQSDKGVRAFIHDPEVAYGAGELPEGTVVFFGGPSDSDDGRGHVQDAVEAGAGLVVLSAFSLFVPPADEPERFYYAASGTLRMLADRSHVAVVVAVQEPRTGWSPKFAAFSFLGEGFEGDRMLRLTPEGTIEVLRP